MPANYFSYFSEIEDYFVQKRGKNLLVSPLDWALIEAWKEEGVPLHIVLRGIDRSFENYRKLGRKSAPTTLSYCHGAVMEAFQEYQESRIGKHPEDEPEQLLEENERRKVLGLMDELLGSLRAVDSTSDLGPVTGRMEELKAEIGRARAMNPSELERELGTVADGLVEILKEELDPGVLRKLEKEIEASLKLYRKRVSSDILQQLYRKQLKQRILDLYGLPDFSIICL